MMTKNTLAGTRFMPSVRSIIASVAAHGVCLLLCLASVAGAEEKKPPKITYDDDVKPVFQQKCFSCHNQDKKSGDLDLTSYSALMQGGASGEVIDPGDSAASYLYELVTHAAEPIMPPESPKIPDPMIETIRKWIDGGVLENSGSTAKAAKKKKYDLALSAPSTERPSVIPLPGRLSLQPHSQPSGKTAVTAISTSPWAPLAAVGGHKEVLLYNTQSLELVGALAFPEGTPQVLKFSRNGGLLLAGGGVGGASGRVVVWNVRSGERIIEIGSELDEVLAADISSDQTLVALGGPQRVVRIYSTETGSLMHEIRKHTDWVTAMEFSPDSVLLATGDRNGGLFVWEGWTGREYLTLKGHTKQITRVSWRSDSNVLASSSEDTTIKLWEMENGGQVKSWGAHGGGAASVEFTRDGRLFSCGRDKVAKLWDQNGGQQRAFEAFADLALRATYCDETNRAIAGDWTGEIRVWNAADGNRLGALQMSAPTLESRLAQATQLVSAKQNEFKPIEAAHTAAQAALVKAKTDFQNAQRVAAEAKQKADAATAALAPAKETLTKVTNEHTVLQQQLAQMSKGVPMLKESAEKAAAAAAQFPGDGKLAETAKSLEASATGKQSELDQLQKTAAEKSAALAEAQQAMQTAQKVATETAATLTAAQQEQQKLMPLVKPAEEKANAAKQAFDKVSAELTAAQQLVSRWTDEIAFSKRLAELTSQRLAIAASLLEVESKQAEVDTTASEANAALAKANSDLAAAQNAFAANKTAYQTALAEVTKAQQAQATATQSKTQSAANVTNLQQLLAKLKETAAKAVEAGALAKDDQQVAAAIAAWNTLVDTKSKILVTASEDLTAKTAAEQAAVQNVAAKEKAAADALAIQAAAEKKVAELTAAVAPLQAAANQAKQAADAAANSVAEVEQKLGEVRKTIAIAQGLEPAA